MHSTIRHEGHVNKRTGRALAERKSVQLSRLRTIGFSLWDPIGLIGPSGKPPSGAENEYDSYLMEVVGMLRNGRPHAECSKLLMEAEADHMGMRGRRDVDKRANKTVQAIDAYLRELG